MGKKEKVFRDPKRIRRCPSGLPIEDPTDQSEDLFVDKLYIASIILSFTCFFLSVKQCGWSAIFCSGVFFALSKCNEKDAKRFTTAIMLAVFALVVTYVNDPSPTGLAWPL